MSGLRPGTPKKPAGRTGRGAALARLGAVALAAAVVTSLAVLGYAARQYAHGFTHVGCIGDRTSLADEGFPSEAVSFATRGGYTLRGWLTHGSTHPEIAMIALPGASGNTQFALPDAKLLAEAGYTTLIYEHRSCADPALLHSGGYFEADDLLAADDYLHTRPEIRHVGVLGFSAGGTAALLAAARQPNLEAVIAEGGFASMTADALDPKKIQGPLDWPIRGLTLVFLSTELGVPATAVSPVSQIGRISPRPVLLIYGEEEAEQGQALFAAAKEPKSLWIVPGTGHGGYAEAEPQAYREHIVGYLEGVFK